MHQILVDCLLGQYVIMVGLSVEVVCFPFSVCMFILLYLTGRSVYTQSD